MNSVAFHFAGGDSFFSGSGLLLLGCLLAAVAKPRWTWAARLAGIPGILAVTLSAIPLPYWLYGAWGVAAVMWLIRDGDGQRAEVETSTPETNSDAEAVTRSKVGKKAARDSRRLRSRYILVGVTLLALGWEVTFRLSNGSSGRTFARLDVIADSVSAGMRGPDEDTWPKQFRALYAVSLEDHSQEGATAKSAQKQACEVKPGPSLVLIEIGGNDVLGRTTADEFDVELDRLLAGLRHVDRELVMLELPLPPFYNRFGMIQRKLARRYDVRLVPRRAFAQLLFTPRATLDGIHLSEQGHRLMAEWIWSEVRASLTSP